MIHTHYKNPNSAEKHKYDSRNRLKPHSLKTVTICILLNALGIMYEFVRVDIILHHMLDPGFSSQQCFGHLPTPINTVLHLLLSLCLRSPSR